MRILWIEPTEHELVQNHYASVPSAEALSRNSWPRRGKVGGAIMLMRGFAACYLLAATTAHATTLTVIQGDVLVNRGSGYERVLEQTEVNPGDTVVVGTTSAAEIAYGQGCVVPVPIGAVATVKSQPPCGPLTTGAFDDPAPNSSLTPTTVASGLAAVGGAGAAALFVNKKKDKPASP
jgi:hypothetical protein